MKKRIFVLFVLCIVSRMAFAGDFVPPRHTIIIGLGGMKYTALDKINSCLPYSGFGKTLLLGYTYDRGRFQLAGSNTFSSGLLKSIQYPDNPQLIEQYLYDKLNVSGYFRIINKPEKSLSLLVGPQIKATLGYRLKANDIGNSLLAYNIATSTNLSVKAIKYFNIKPIRRKNKVNRDLSIEGYFSFPLVSQVYYQPYIGLPDDVLNENSNNIDPKSQYSAVLTEYIDWDWGLNFKFYLHNSNAIGLNYNYSYIRTKPEVNPYRGQMQSVMFILYFGLK